MPAMRGNGVQYRVQVAPTELSEAISSKELALFDSQQCLQLVVAAEVQMGLFLIQVPFPPNEAP